MKTGRNSSFGGTSSLTRKGVPAGAPEATRPPKASIHLDRHVPCVSLGSPAAITVSLASGAVVGATLVLMGALVGARLVATSCGALVLVQPSVAACTASREGSGSCPPVLLSLGFHKCVEHHARRQDDQEGGIKHC